MKRLALVALASAMLAALIIGGFAIAGLNCAACRTAAVGRWLARIDGIAYAAPSEAGRRANGPPNAFDIKPNGIYHLSASFDKAFAHMLGGTVMPCNVLQDPYPEYNGIALDPKNNLAVLSDTNLKSALVYKLDVAAPPASPNVTPYNAWVKGPDTFLSFAAGVAVDPVRKEFYTTENDIGDDVAAFSYGANGNYKSRVLAVPHGSYGIAVSQHYKQIAVAIEHDAEIIFYKVQASGADRPLRSIRGSQTGLHDPHGVVWDDQHGEILVSNYGNWNRGYWDADYSGGGRYYPPSITVFSDGSKGNVAPLRTIKGPATEFNWPTGIAVDDIHNELYVANEATNQVLVFKRDANGNVAPLRILGGPHTHISHPMGVAYDWKNDQLWVANFGHTAEVFDRLASGDTAPKRLLRNAPEGTPAAGFGNPQAIAYDSKRDELLIPNCVTDPRIAAFSRTASGNIRPVRDIEGQKTKLTRVAHGIAYDPAHDLIIATEPLAGSIVFLPGGANGDTPPVRVIQGPHTMIHNPWQPAVDDKHNELWIADITSNQLLVFPLDGNGDIAPLRVIKGGPKSGLRIPSGVAVDPDRNLVVASAHDGNKHFEPALMVFNRTDSGDVAPKAVIEGPTTGLVSLWHLAVHDGKIFAVAGNWYYSSPYDEGGFEPKPGCKGPPLSWQGPLGFVGVWNETDNGDVAPHAIVRGADTDLLHPSSVALVPKYGQIFVVDSVRNGAFGYLVPNFF